MDYQEKLWQEGIDSKALMTCYIRKLPMLLFLSVAGAVIGSGLHLLLALFELSVPVYVSETEYYIDFADGQLEAKNHYNDFTWNDVIATDSILGNAMTMLGDDFVRERVKDMITADILSDVRYLTITIQGEQPEQVGMVRDALGAALESFGANQEEFDAIYKIEDLGIVKATVPLFIWRAALLGAVVLTVIGVFAIAFRFCLGTCIYTKSDLLKYFGIPVFGMLYSKGNEKDGRQEKRLIACLKKTTADLGLVYCSDTEQNRIAEAFLRQLNQLEAFDGNVRFELFDEGHCKPGAQVIMVVPFGTPCRERMADELEYLRQMDYQVIGCVLAEVDKRWMKLYQGTKYF